MSRRPSIKVTRDGFLFCLGVIGLVYETLSGGAEKPTLIIAFVGLLGLPLFLRNDERLPRRDDYDDDGRSNRRPRRHEHEDEEST